MPLPSDPTRARHAGRCECTEMGRGRARAARPRTGPGASCAYGLGSRRRRDQLRPESRGDRSGCPGHAAALTAERGGCGVAGAGWRVRGGGGGRLVGERRSQELCSARARRGRRLTGREISPVPYSAPHACRIHLHSCHLPCACRARPEAETLPVGASACSPPSCSVPWVQAEASATTDHCNAWLSQHKRQAESEARDARQLAATRLKERDTLTRQVAPHARPPYSAQSTVHTRACAATLAHDRWPSCGGASKIWRHS